MGALKVIYILPLIKLLLAIVKVSKHSVLKHLRLESTMEPFVLTQSLRMIGTRMNHGNPKTYQPNRQLGVRMPFSSPPRVTVVHQNRMRQTIASENVYQFGLHSNTLLIWTCLQSQCISGMVVKHSEWMTAPFIQSKMAFEVHLPHLIGSIVLEALPGLVLSRFGWVYSVIAPQDPRDAAGAWYVLVTEGSQASMNLPRAPGGVSIAHAHNQTFNMLRSTVGRDVGTARPITQAFSAFPEVSGHPLVASLTTDCEPRTELGYVRSFLHSERYKLMAKGQRRNLLPGHSCPPFSLVGVFQF